MEKQPTAGAEKNGQVEAAPDGKKLPARGLQGAVKPAWPQFPGKGWSRSTALAGPWPLRIIMEIFESLKEKGRRGRAGFWRPLSQSLI